jgi:hypothetical protein
LVLRLGKLDIEREISRRDFEGWIAYDIARIEQTVDHLLQTEGVPVEEIDNGSRRAAAPSFRRFATHSSHGLARIGSPTAKISSRSPLASRGSAWKTMWAPALLGLRNMPRSWTARVPFNGRSPHCSYRVISWPRQQNVGG